MNFIKLLERQLPPLNEKITTNNVIKFNQALPPSHTIENVERKKKRKININLNFENNK